MYKHNQSVQQKEYEVPVVEEINPDTLTPKSREACRRIGLFPADLKKKSDSEIADLVKSKTGATHVDKSTISMF